MQFNLNRTIEILRATPLTLNSLLGGLSSEWLAANEGDKTWSPQAVVAHLVYAEEVNWIPRMRKILADGDNRFVSFNPEGQFDFYASWGIDKLLEKFQALRRDSVMELSALAIDEALLSRKGVHPTLGEVSLAQLLSTWTVHDLDHINQISRVLAKQYKEAVGPWVDFLGVLRRPL